MFLLLIFSLVLKLFGVLQFNYFVFCSNVLCFFLNIYNVILFCCFFFPITLCSLKYIWSVEKLSYFVNCCLVLCHFCVLLHCYFICMFLSSLSLSSSISKKFPTINKVGGNSNVMKKIESWKNKSNYILD